MITQLYIFSPGSYVVAEEWNANFSTLYSVSLQHEESISDARTEIAFPNSDLSDVFSAVNAYANSHTVGGLAFDLYAGQEYYKSLLPTDTLSVILPVGGINGEARILLYIPANRNDIPFNVIYPGGTYNIDYGAFMFFEAGYYYVFVHDINNVATFKIISAGV